MHNIDALDLLLMKYNSLKFRVEKINKLVIIIVMVKWW